MTGRSRGAAGAGRGARWAAAVLLLSGATGIASPAGAAAKERTGTVTFDVKLAAPPEAREVRLWVPYPVSGRFQTVDNVSVKGNFTSTSTKAEPRNGATALFAEWKGPMAERTLTYSFTVRRSEAVMKDFPTEEGPVPAGMQPFLDNSALGDARLRLDQIAAEVTAGKGTVLEKARAVYDWVVDTMRRDPDVKGCGLCEVERLLVEKGGKCADISGVFVGLARAAGVPARDIYGIRMHKEREGDITHYQKCWAEFFLPGYGWVPVDPADVLKFKLVKNPSPAELQASRDYFFGAVDESRLQLNSGDRVVLDPAPRAGALRYFMYPWAEADGKPLNEDLFGYNLGYTITFQEQ